MSFLIVIVLAWSTVHSVIYPDSPICDKCSCCADGKYKCINSLNSEYTAHCDTCIEGHWGGVCRPKCPIYCIACEKEPVRGGNGSWPYEILYHICTKCVEGKYLGSTNYTKNCTLDCPLKCLACTSSESCTSCKLGYFGLTCDEECSAGCEGGVCNKTTGICSCKTRFVGAKCEHCSNTYYGQSCSSKCSNACLDQLCYKETGFCKNCTKEKFGNMCEKTCPENCKGIVCNRVSGDCHTCKGGFYGFNCHLACADNCDDGCAKRSGECNRCKKNTYGRFCNNSCQSTCRSKDDLSLCEEAHGTCLYGCTQGYYGKFCDTLCIKICPDGFCDQIQGICPKELGASSPSIAGPTAGGTVGAVVIIVAVFVGVFFYKRRKLSLKPNFSDKGYAYATSSNVNFTDSREDVGETKTVGKSRKTKKQTITDSGVELEDPNEKIVEEGEVSYATVSDKDAYYNVTLKVKVSELYGYVTRKSVEQYKQEFKFLPKELSKPYSCARKPENVTRNRYTGIYPYDESRVTLKNDPDFFINANYIRGYKKDKGYVASLGPTKVATDDFKTFWKMVWHEKSDVIVMLTKLQEIGGMKCEQYWPNLEETVTYGKIKVSCQGETIFAEHTERRFTAYRNREKRLLTQFHFTAWPDKGVPDHVVSLVEFWQRIKRCARLTGGPDIVHCSAGIGRTGTFIAIDRLIDEGKAEGSVNVYGCILDMREQRVSMVQTPEQYIYLHKALVYTLALECEDVSSETFLQCMDSTSAGYNNQFQMLQKTVEDENDNEKKARARNVMYTMKNRPCADIPGDYNRPRLHLNKSFNDSDYINAIFADSLKRKNAFIITQTPLPSTLEDFVTLLYQEECSCIVSLEQEQLNEEDVGVYLPADNLSLTVGPFTITGRRCESKPHYLVRRLKIQYSDKQAEKERTMYHFKYVGWPKWNHVPEDPKHFLQFINDVKWKAAAGATDEESKPVLIHCLDAFSRCGLFCVVANVIEKMQTERHVSIPNTIRQIRTRRNGTITNTDQLEFLYRCAAVHLEKFLNLFTTYSNVDS